MRSEAVRGMDLLSMAKPGSLITKRDLFIDLVCHREFHLDSVGLDADTSIVYEYECRVVSWLLKQRIKVRATSHGQVMEGILDKR